MDQLAPESVVDLGPLDGAAVLLVVRDMLGADPDDELLALAMRSGGSPFLLVELLHGLLDEGRVQVENGKAQVVGRSFRIGCGSRSASVLGSGHQPARELAGVAAVLGRRFTHDQLAAMVGNRPRSCYARSMSCWGRA